ncbi:hypothetical protein B0J11DRAFT_562007 [Dendryphion nanum]|uniref:LIM zinc-binding domain-containing protein n=1 Tax=Dendryphion nanum TaxID=256645 RepID=A0A9P9IB47_9PLEO|nr:hypothetical protein B0J11DRAFT_562007 [Dendryphion nanum]
MRSAKERERAASPGPTYMSSQQMSSYLQDLRNNRPSRPIGSRPPPAHFNTWSSRSNTRFADSPVASSFTEPTHQDAGVDTDVSPQAASEQPKTHKRTTSNMSIDEILAGTAGRALVQPPRGREISRSTNAGDRTPSVQYRESGRRQVEREEARVLRMALEELDLQNEEKVYTSARDEAAELVWKHLNPDAPGANPNAPYAYPGADKRSHSRSQSLGRSERESDLQRSNSRLRKRSSMGSSAGGSRSSSLQSRRPVSSSSNAANADFGTSPTKESFKDDEKADAPSALPKVSSNPTDPKQGRRSSSGRRKISGSLFKNPADQIYEEPEEELPPPPAVTNPPPPAKLPLGQRRNPFSRVKLARENSLMRSNTDPIISTKRFDRYEIQNNPPTQSRNAGYTLNSAPPKATEAIQPNPEKESESKMKDGIEIRGDDIRAATSFRLKDRSGKLPTPTLVSDAPGRPIVSFKNDWLQKEIVLKEETSSFPQSAPKPLAQTDLAPRPLQKAATVPVVPTINFPGEPAARRTAASPSPIPKVNVAPVPSAPVPSTRVNRTQIPTISVYEDPPARPLPNAITSRKVNTPQSAAPPVPTINVSQAPAARSKSTQSVPIPTISIQETPKISISPSDRGVKVPSISVTPIPSISVNGPTASPRGVTHKSPSISVTPSVPSINVNGPAASNRPLPNPRNYGSKTFPRNNSNTTNSRPHWTPTAARTGVLCEHCALPISGRIVSAAGSRFHPECFQCHQCGEHLECVAFYPEPDNKRAERIARIQARLHGEDIEFLPTHPTLEDMMRLEQQDGDEGMRFFCHLDFHELFSPRCKSCKTPIEGEVVVACGAEWHVGHFFCAQCGDPFDSTTPFVEKDGYAWCVGCHTNRYSTKCRKCKKPVVDTVVKALGSEWHVGCFCCVECSGPFQDGRYFLRGESSDPVCVKCEERRLKA